MWLFSKLFRKRRRQPDIQDIPDIRLSQEMQKMQESRTFRTSADVRGHPGHPGHPVSGQEQATQQVSEQDTQQPVDKQPVGMAFVIGNKFGDLDGRLQHVEKAVEKMDGILDRLARLETRLSDARTEMPLPARTSGTSTDIQDIRPSKGEEKILDAIKAGTPADDREALAQATGLQIDSVRRLIQRLQDKGLL